MALKDVGRKRLTSYESDASAEGLDCRLFYDQTRQEILRGFDWPFARKRQTLSQDTTTPDFEYAYRYQLPTDYLCTQKRANNLEYDSDEEDDRWTIEGNYILTNDSSVELKYVSDIEDISKFDPLFTRILILRLSLQLLPAGAGISGTASTRDRIERMLGNAEKKARTVAFQEDNTTGRSDWNNARSQDVAV